jgi:hypothetical protein
MVATLASLLASWALAADRVSLQGHDELNIERAVNSALDGPILRVEGMYWKDGAVNTSPTSRARTFLAIHAIATHPNATTLVNLDVSSTPFDSSMVGMLLAPGFAGIRVLAVPTLEASAVATLAHAPFASRLIELRVRNPLPPSAVGALATAFPALERLDLGNTAPATAAALGTTPFPRLQSLTLRCEPDCTETLTALAAPGALPTLRSLTFYDGALALSGAQALVDSGLARHVTRLQGHMADRSIAAYLGGAAPDMTYGNGHSDPGAAWSSARAAAVREHNRVPTSVSIYADEDAARLRGIVEIEGDLILSAAVTDLSPLRHLVRVGGSVQIHGTTALTDLDGLRTLRTVGKDIKILANEQLREVELRSLTTVGGALSIHWYCSGNPRLAEISFPSLASVGALGVSRETGGLDGDGSRCWCIDCPKGTSYVSSVRVRTFRRLVNIGTPSPLVKEAPWLFPALRPGASAD